MDIISFSLLLLTGCLPLAHKEITASLTPSNWANLRWLIFAFKRAFFILCPFSTSFCFGLYPYFDSPTLARHFLAHSAFSSLGRFDLHFLFASRWQSAHQEESPLLVLLSFLNFSAGFSFLQLVHLCIFLYELQFAFLFYSFRVISIVVAAVDFHPAVGRCPHIPAAGLRNICFWIDGFVAFQLSLHIFRQVTYDLAPASGN